MEIFFLLLGICIVIIIAVRNNQLSPKPKIDELHTDRSSLDFSFRLLKENIKSWSFEEHIDESHANLNTWYRLQRWKRPNYLKMQTEWPSDWTVIINEEMVVGVTFNERKDWFLLMGDYPDFRIFLEREPDNPVDPNAIKVMGSATSDKGKIVAKHLGYLSKETAYKLKNYKMIDARPYSTVLPIDNGYFELIITILLNRKELFEPIGNVKPLCPYCNFYLEKMPARKKACPNCKEFIFVRTRPYDRKKVLVTDKQVEEIQEQYSKKGQ